MIGFYNYTVILTYASLLISSTGICLAGGQGSRAQKGAVRRGGGDADHSGKNAEANDVAKGIDLNAEAPLLLGAFFSRAGDLAVEHVADTRGQ